jgi:SGNH domain-containing protein
VLAIRDNPRFDRSMPDCVQQAADDPAAPVCGVERAAVYAPEPPWTHLPDVPSNVRFLDIADRVCGPDLCPAVIGNVLVYLDDNHLTASYSTSMSPLVESDVLAAIGL